MPETRPGLTQSIIATKATAHGKPVVESGHAGIANKSSQAQPAYPTPANALAAQQIAVGEEMVISMGGVHPIAFADLPGGGGVGVGDKLWIRQADNVIVMTGAVAGTAEVQTVTLANATGGTFTLTFDGDTTAGINFNATAADVRAALEALDTIDPGDVLVTGSAGGPYTVTFQGQYFNEDVPAMTASNAGLTGSSPTVTVATATAGAAEAAVKFGRVSEVDPVREVAQVNLNLRDTF